MNLHRTMECPKCQRVRRSWRTCTPRRRRTRRPGARDCRRGVIVARCTNDSPDYSIGSGIRRGPLGAAPHGQSVVWLKASTVTFSTTPFRIVVNLAKTHLYVYDHNQRVLDVPAGVGTPEAPTPIGKFFVAFFAQPPSPGYGPFVMVTSAHSNAISDWDHSGDAMVAIHGPLGDSAQIGATWSGVVLPWVHSVATGRSSLASHCPRGKPHRHRGVVVRDATHRNVQVITILKASTPQ